MLPEILSNGICSLNPGVDRLTFSVIWKMDGNGQIKDFEIRKSVINSCAKLAYEHVQGVIDGYIDNDDDEALDIKNVEICNDFTIDQVNEMLTLLILL